MEEIINSVMQSPENTNPNVLRSQLQSVSAGSGGGEPFIVEIEGISTEQGPSTTAVFADAKAAFFAGRIIIFSFSLGGPVQKVYVTSYVDFGEGKERFTAYLGGNSILSWNSDGTFGRN